jgi:YidC/Oxa1 family membrane protein insertase
MLDPALNLAYLTLTTLADGVRPLVGSAAVAIAVVMITLVARACLLPLAVSVLRADRAKRALAPELERIRRKHGSDPARLSRELLAAHRDSGISPLAGLLPALAQAPAMLVIYRLCKVPVIAGGQNVVLAAQLLGAPLAGHLPAVIATAGLLSGPTLVVAGLLTALLGLAYLTSKQQVRRLQESAVGKPIPATQLLVARVLPYGTVLAAAVVPLAVSLYLVTSTAWLVAERALLPRLF